MRVVLDKENRFVTEDGKLDLKREFIYSGIKAAWCYKKGTATPEDIRATSEESLIRMGINTFLSDHGTPDEHDQISVEVTGIPKLLCMILNDEHQYTTCERSLRYTKVLPSEYISDLEVKKYNKWCNIYTSMFETQYKDWFLKVNQNDIKLAKKDMQKKAQENARNFVSILTPTSIAYSAPFYQWQKIATFLKDMIKNPRTPLEKLALPYAKDFIKQLLELKIVVTTKDAIEIYPPLKDDIKDNREWLYRNNKGIKLSLFASNNPFSGIHRPNEFSTVVNYNSEMSFSAFAQAQRHRTTDFECELLDEYRFVIPPIIKGTTYEKEYISDMMEVKKLYPQGQLIQVNLNSSLKNIINFMGQERACELAQQEIENWYVNQLLPDVVEGLSQKEAYQEEYKILTKQYLNRCRCAYPNYHCPRPCGHPRTTRPF